MIDPRTLLEQAQFLAELSPAGKDALAAIARARNLRKKEVLFREGEKGRAVFLLSTGHIRLARTTPDGREMVIKIVQPGEFFAEVILFEKDEYPVTATATDPGVVLEIPRLQLHDLLAHREFRADFIAMLMKKQRYLADRLYQLTTVDVETRFVHFLREPFGESPSIAIPFAKKEIAAAIGATPETFSRMVLKLKKQRLLQWKGKTLQLSPKFWKLT
jgi:CRP/FNR family transcriptional regulator